jgi:tRNA-splicing ligase RtcB
MEILTGPGVPVYSWAPALEEGARTQARHCAGLPVTHHHVAVMADGHQGYGVPIGAVLPLRDAISPYAVGNDIGCGMALVPTTLGADDLLAPLPRASGARGPEARDDVMTAVATTIPSGTGTRTPTEAPDVDALIGQAWDALVEAARLSGLPLSTSQTPVAAAGRPLDRNAFHTRARAQAGTLGSGNHFIELLRGDDGTVAVMLHSGSRGAGAQICNNFHRMALKHCAAAGVTLPDPGLAWLPLVDSDAGDRDWAAVGRAYVRALKAALEYARLNRDRMLRDVGAILEQRFPAVMRFDDMVNIHHNDATLEEHYGAQVWVHRKGAVKAAVGTDTIIPGSMATGSYQGRGLGNREAFESCSHGAGRRMSRGQARRTLDLDEQLRLLSRVGSKVFAASVDAVLDEMGGAYKDLDEVMRAQADLVEPVRRFSPVATYKGADVRGRRRRR